MKEKPILKTLKNGVRVLMIPQPAAATATALILVGTGSKYETKNQNGISHFLEHLCFKGTEKRPSAKIIAETFEGIGAVNNAFTSHEYTGYYAKGSPEQVSTFLEVLSDIYLQSTFPTVEIEKEKGVILEEMNMYEDMLPNKVAEAMVALMYRDQPAGWPIIGTKETVSAMNRADIVGYQHMHYRSDNTIIVLSGAIDPVQALKQTNEYFGAVADEKKSKKPEKKLKKHLVKKKTIDTQDAFRMTVIEKPSDQAHLALGFRALPYGHPDAAAVSLLATILGRGMSSRLFQHLREEMGVAYYVNTEQDALTDHGIFAITAGIDKTRLTEVLVAIVSELTLIKTELVSDQELAKAREYMFGMFRLGLESSDSIAEFYGRQLVLKNEVKTPAQVMQEYTAVTVRDIRRLAKKLFVSSRANLAVVGPYQADTFDASPLHTL